MLVVLLSHSGDEHVEPVAAQLGDRVFTLRSDRPFTCHLGGDAPSSYLAQDGRRVCVAEIGSVWDRRLFTTPGVESAIQHFVRVEQRTAVLGALEALIPEARWVNAPSAARRASDKLAVLREAERAGLRCPGWMVSNDASRIAAVAAAWGSTLVLKPLTATVPLAQEIPALMFARPLDVAQLGEALGARRRVPMFLQRRVEKVADVRVTVIDDDHEAARMTGCPSESLDFRKEYGRLRYDRVALPPEILRPLLRLLRVLGLRYGAVDFVEDRDGALWFLEVNPAGQFGWLEKSTGEGGPCRFVEKLSRALLDGARP